MSVTKCIFGFGLEERRQTTLTPKTGPLQDSRQQERFHVDASVELYMREYTSTRRKNILLSRGRVWGNAILLLDKGKTLLNFRCRPLVKCIDSFLCPWRPFPSICLTHYNNLFFLLVKKYRPNTVFQPLP